MPDRHENGAKPALTIDVSEWRMKEVKAWQRACAENNLTLMTEIIATVVKAWPHEGNPTDPAAYDELKASDWGSIANEVGAKVGELFRGT